MREKIGCRSRRRRRLFILIIFVKWDLEVHYVEIREGNAPLRVLLPWAHYCWILIHTSSASGSAQKIFSFDEIFPCFLFFFFCHGCFNVDRVDYLCKADECSISINWFNATFLLSSSDLRWYFFFAPPSLIPRERMLLVQKRDDVRGHITCIKVIGHEPTTKGRGRL